jgi:spectinomycin phosphotransferase
MQNRAHLPDDRLCRVVQTGYGIAVTALTLLPLGLDSAARTYRADAADGRRYFLKVRTARQNPAGLLAAHFLHAHGVTSVVAPVATRADGLWVEVDGHVLLLYPYIEGSTGVDAGMDAHHWLTLGETLHRVHAAALPADLARRVPRERFSPAWLNVVRRLDRSLTTRWPADPSEQELAAFWRARRAEIEVLVARAVALGRRLRATAPPPVLCHADIHPRNILIDRVDRLWVVDWDEVRLAPKECDLLFVMGGLGGYPVGPEAEARFFTGYGDARVDPLALAYYRYARAVDDIGGFGEAAVLLPDGDAAGKRAAVEGLKRLFAPGRIVALAYAADPDGPTGRGRPVPDQRRKEGPR